MIKINDTHQHLWDLERINLPWLDNVPALKKGHLSDDYLKAAEGTGIYRTVYMEVDAYAGHKQKEIEDMTLLCKSNEEFMQGMVISGNPGSSGFPKMTIPCINSSSDLQSRVMSSISFCLCSA